MIIVKKIICFNATTNGLINGDKQRVEIIKKFNQTNQIGNQKMKSYIINASFSFFLIILSLIFNRKYPIFNTEFHSRYFQTID